MGRPLSSVPILLALVLGAVGCRDKHQPAPPAPAPSTAPSATVSPLPQHAVAGEVAFELVATDDGALLAVGAKTGGLSLLFLDATGQEVGAALTLGSEVERVVEIAGAALGNRVGLAYVTRHDAAAASYGVLGDASTRSFAAPSALTPTTLGDLTRRGHVAFAASDKNEMVAVVRGLDEPCGDDKQRSCAAYRFRELLSTGPELRGLPMSVPTPCPATIAGFAIVGARWHYGFCSQASGQPRTTAFMRQLSPFYVGVTHSPPGCAPLGVTRIGSEALFAVQCGDIRRALRIGGMDSPEQSLVITNTTLDCRLGRPRLTLPGEPPLTLDLAASTSGLGPLLPESVAAANSRAVWTGSSLLVASWVRAAVVLRRYECRGAELARSG